MKKLSNQFKLGIAGAIVTALAGVVPTASAGDGPSILFEATVGTDAANCAATTEITVFPGSMVNYCYTVTNDGTVTFNTHDLDSDAFGNLLSDAEVTLAPGESFEFFNTQTASSTVTQTATWSAFSDTFTITTSDDTGGPAFNFIDISATGTPLGLGDDAEADVVMGFSFNLSGVDSTDMTVGNNGAVRFGITGDDIAFTNTPLADDVPGNLIAPFWDDFDSESGDVFHETVGTAPDRIFIVQWNDRPHFNGATDAQTNATVQMQLFEGSNEIQFHYLDVLFDNINNPDWDNGGSATIGVGGGQGAAQFSFNTPSVSDSFAISLVPTGVPAGGSTDTSMTTVTVNEADIEVPQTGLDYVLNADQMDSQDLDIMNVGTLILNWDLEQGTSRATRQFERLAGMPAIKSPDTNASMGPAPIPSLSTLPAGKEADAPAPILLGTGTAASAVRSFGDPVQTLSEFDISAPTTVNDILTDAAYDGLFAGDFVGIDFTTLYALRGADNELVSIDTTTGAITSIGFTLPPPGAELWSGMSWDPITGDMYVNSATNPGSTLFTINLTDATTTLVGTMTTTDLIIDIAFDINGNLYGAALLTDELVGIDKTNGALTSIGPLGININFAQDLDFDYTDNTLYLSSCLSNLDCGRLFTVNLATGATTEVGQIGGAVGEYTAFGIQGVAFCDEPVTWLSFSEIAGSTNFGQTSTVSVMVDTTGLALGNYEADICINSDDPDEPITVVPVTLEVNDLNNDIIFANGFEAPIPVR